MPTSIHPKLRMFQKAREATGKFQDLGPKTAGYALREAQEDASTVVFQDDPNLTFRFVGTVKTSADLDALDV